jgi:hypothetical protein
MELIKGAINAVIFRHKPTNHKGGEADRVPTRLVLST